MGLLFILLLSVGLPLLYLTPTAYAGHYMAERSRLSCQYRYSTKDKDGRCIESSGACVHGANFFYGLFWPILPLFLMSMKPAASMAMAHHKGITRADRRYAKELAQANHRQALNAIREKEIARLEREVGIR